MIDFLRALSITTISFFAVQGGLLALGCLLYVLFFTRYWWLTALYLIWIWGLDKGITKRGGRTINWFRSWSWFKYSRDYFPVRLVKLPSVELDPQKNYLFCVFPHGLLCFGFLLGLFVPGDQFRNCFPLHQIRGVILTFFFKLPILREILLYIGGIDSSGTAMDYILSQPSGGYVLALMVGGMAEAYHCKPGDYTFVLKKRTGFVRHALKNGAQLVPVISFGETDTFTIAEGRFLRSIRGRLKKLLGCTPLFPNGRFGPLPYKVPITIVVGNPLEVPIIAEPTQADIKKYHEKFVMELTKLFEEQKCNYLSESETKHLQIV